MAWYKFLRASDNLVLVEDQVSAIKLCPHVHSAALLGTNISPAKLEEIKKGNYKRIYLVLDNDAIGEAIKIQIRLRESLPNMYILGIQKDVKDMNEQEFNNFLERIK